MSGQRSVPAVGHWQGGAICRNCTNFSTQEPCKGWALQCAWPQARCQEQHSSVAIVDAAAVLALARTHRRTFSRQGSSNIDERFLASCCKLLTVSRLDLQGNDIFAETVEDQQSRSLAFSESKLHELSGSDIFGSAQQVRRGRWDTPAQGRRRAAQQRRRRAATGKRRAARAAWQCRPLIAAV